MDPKSTLINYPHDLIEAILTGIIDFQSTPWTKIALVDGENQCIEHPGIVVVEWAIHEDIAVIVSTHASLLLRLSARGFRPPYRLDCSPCVFQGQCTFLPSRLRPGFVFRWHDLPYSIHLVV